MKKKLIALLTASMLLLATGCGQKAEEVVEEVPETAEVVEEETEEVEEIEEIALSDDTVIRVGSLKGPTTMGLVNLMDQADKGETTGNYEFSMEAAPDVLLQRFIAGEVDVALLPSNLAAVAYNRTKGTEKELQVLYINTLGVLELVTGDESVTSFNDLAGKTLLISGQGATPEYTVNYLLAQAGITDCTLEFHSEHSEIAALLAEDPTQVAILPQPFSTATKMQNQEIHTVVNLTDVWNEVTTDGSSLITGVTVVNRAFAEVHPEVIQNFMAEAKASSELANSDIDGTASLVVAQGILEKEPAAKAALPNCKITYMDGEEMKAALSGYLQVLFDADETSVGGAMPEDDLYFIAE